MTGQWGRRHGDFVPHMLTCICGKRGYHNRREARQVAKEMRRNHMLRADAVRLCTYKCHTGVWHVGNRHWPGPNVNDPRIHFLEDT